MTWKSYSSTRWTNLFWCHVSSHYSEYNNEETRNAFLNNMTNSNEPSVQVSEKPKDLSSLVSKFMPLGYITEALCPRWPPVGQNTSEIHQKHVGYRTSQSRHHVL